MCEKTCDKLVTTHPSLRSIAFTALVLGHFALCTLRSQEVNAILPRGHVVTNTNAQFPIPTFSIIYDISVNTIKGPLTPTQFLIYERVSKMMASDTHLSAPPHLVWELQQFKGDKNPINAWASSGVPLCGA